MSVTFNEFKEGVWIQDKETMEHVLVPHAQLRKLAKAMLLVADAHDDRAARAARQQAAQAEAVNQMHRLMLDDDLGLVRFWPNYLENRGMTPLEIGEQADQLHEMGLIDIMVNVVCADGHEMWRSKIEDVPDDSLLECGECWEDEDLEERWHKVSYIFLSRVAGDDGGDDEQG